MTQPGLTSGLPARTHDELIASAGRKWAAACARQDALSPRQAAAEAYVPGGPPVDELEARIRRRRESWST